MKFKVIFFIFTILFSTINYSYANPQRAAIGVLRLSAGKAKSALTGELNSIFKGNSNVIPRVKNIKLYGASNDDMSGDLIHVYGIDSTNKKSGIYLLSLTMPVRVSTVSGTLIIPGSVDTGAIAYRENYSDPVKFNDTLTFTSDPLTSYNEDFTLKEGCKVTAPDENFVQMVYGTLVQEVDVNGNLVPVTGRFVLTLFDAAYNDL